MKVKLLLQDNHKERLNPAHWCVLLCWFLVFEKGWMRYVSDPLQFHLIYTGSFPILNQIVQPKARVCVYFWMNVQAHATLCVSHASFYTGVCVLMLDCCCVCVWMLVCLSTCAHVHTSRYMYPLPDGCLLALLFPCSVCVWLLTVWTVMCDRSHFRDPIITSA